MDSTAITFLVGKYPLSVRPCQPYSDPVCEFLNALSSRLRKDSSAKQYPDIQTFSFWCRKANIARLKSEYEDGNQRLGRGLVFHIAPSNVPINFAFSFVFGLLSGNGNFVRVPSKPFPQTDIVTQAIREILSEERFKAIADSTAFVRYERNDEITREISAQSQARIIWGGDTAIRSIHQFPIDVRGVEIAFADRYSLCLINAEAIAAASEAQLLQLGQSFYNDTYLMDQNACSSPHLILWQNNPCEQLKAKFWKSVFHAAQKYDLPAVKAVDKLTLMCSNAVDFPEVEGVIRHGNLLWRSNLKSIPPRLTDLRGKFGLFYEYNLSDLDELIPVINSKIQTLTVFGVDKSQISRWIINNGITGIDRVTDIGTALDIGVIWDGFDIVKTLSRIISIS